MVASIPDDIATILDDDGVEAIRAGHHQALNIT